eukprot:TRINITY_DN2578_c0_g1_i1.p1 TRINITY_DN2578_c0_g1~~TRINITY_DN2578_c0_g1_i1.p1  ORF type:complete len:188 (+),score=65.51 TRINITY_DN2578_c0_g1_i1:80-565(+)
MATVKATFGAGCFWGVEKLYRKNFPNLKSIHVGYLGGNQNNPSYRDVCTGKTGHAEVVQMEYDPQSIKYRDLVTFFWRIHDPTTLNKQGNDAGTQYRSAVFYHNEEQLSEAKEVMEEIKSKFKNPIVTTFEPASQFWKAEDYHQDYLTANPNGYCNHKFYW